MKGLAVAGALLGLLSLAGSPALSETVKAAETPRVGQVVIESMGPASGTIPKGKLAAVVNYIHADKHTWYRNGGRHTARYPFNKGTQRNLHDRFVLKMRYGLGDGYDVRFALPVVMNNFRAHSTLTPNGVNVKTAWAIRRSSCTNSSSANAKARRSTWRGTSACGRPPATRPMTGWARVHGA